MLDNRMLHNTKMPDILGVAGADEAQRAELEKKARDVAAFLMWASDPKADERKAQGKFVLLYLAVLTLLLYLLKRRVWKNAKPGPDPLESVEVRM